MKKETLIASVLGLTLGIIVAGAILFRMSYQEEDKNVIAQEEDGISPTIVQQEDEENILTVDQPENDIVVNTNTITISGTTTKDSLIVIQSPTGQDVVKTTDASYETTVPLSIGENVIMVSYYPKESSTVFQEKELHIYYIPQ